MELIVKAKHRFCRLITNLTALKLKRDCQIYSNKITGTFNIVSFYIRS